MRRLAMCVTLLFAGACGEPPPPEWHDEGVLRWRELTIPRRGRDGFVSMSPSQTGLEFTNTIEGLAENRHYTHGSGVALGDVDGDGLTDIVLARIFGPNALYRNLGGWRFEDVTAEAGIAAEDRRSTGAVLVDVDGDRDLDLVLTALGGPNALYLNDGAGSFSESGPESGLASTEGSTTIALADVDSDGDLDLYVTNYKAVSALDTIPPDQLTFDAVVEQVGDEYRVRPEYEKDFRVFVRPDLGSVVYVQRGEPDALYVNDGLGHFTHVPFTSDRFLAEDGTRLTEPPDHFGLSARFYDVTGDGAPELYVANDFEDPDHFWVNDGSGGFRAAPRLALRATSNSAMAVDFADVDRDGDVDIFEVDMLSRDRRHRQAQNPTHTALPKQIGVIDDRPQTMRNSLFVNRGDATFAEVAAMAGVEASDWSWGTMFLDVDLDGYEDILVTTGHLWDIMDADTQQRLGTWGGDWRDEFLLYPDLNTPNVAFRNRGDLTFEEVGSDWGFAVGEDISHGIASGDLDGDGDLDVVVTRLNEPVLALRNESIEGRIAVRLIGRAPNTDGIGARIMVTSSSLPDQQREVTSGGLYLSGSSSTQAFAVADAEVDIEVRWRDGSTTLVASAGADRLYEIREGDAPATVSPPDPVAEDVAFFEDVSHELGHVHVELDFDEETRQKLLPNSLARLGPGVTWYDVDRDGDEDLLVPSGRGGRLGYFRNDGTGFTNLSARFDADGLDQTAVLPDPGEGGRTKLLVGRMSYEATDPAGALSAPGVVSFEVSGGGGLPVVLGDTSSVGPLTSSDVDGDGDLDLFVGGRVVPGAYPFAGSSRLFLREGDGFVLDERNRARFSSLGLVSAATFSDIDDDGDPDLIVAVEWGALELFVNEAGVFSAATDEWGLDAFRSRWNGVTTGDLDGDGRLDIVATSWGRNTTVRPSLERPLVLYYGDFDRNGSVDLLSAQRDEAGGELYPVEPLLRLGSAMPFLTSRVGSFQEFADRSLEDLFGGGLSAAGRLEITSLDHIVLFNRGDRFELEPLPDIAQFAPAFHVGIADLDGDGNEDVFLSQNFFATPLGTPRYDAGRGLWLRGDGRGGLVAVPGQESGILVYGEGRGAALADFDGDARVDIAVAQNGAATRLFHNVGATPGLRVRLDGPRENPDGVGALVRLVYPDRLGPVREVKAGSGYWSMDGAVQVLGAPAGASAVRIRWPDGGVTEELVPEGALEVTVRR